MEKTVWQLTLLKICDQKVIKKSVVACTKLFYLTKWSFELKGSLMVAVAKFGIHKKFQFGINKEKLPAKIYSVG